MINKPTTLILGAGASAPFGFPTGNELKQKVLALDNTHVQFGLFPQIHVESFKRALSKSGKTSVDAFLEHRPEFIDIGKRAIAIILIEFENEDGLFSHNENNWYEYLFNQLNTKFDDFDKNKLSILTFNYDRSLEHYLYTCLLNAYGKSVDECAKKLRSIPIVHLHGDLGELPYLFGTNSMRPYSTKLSDGTVGIASQRIKIIHEGMANDPQFAQAQKILSESQHICFLGFGYHHLNIKRLGFKDTGSYAYRATLWGSTKGFTYEELNHLSRLFSGQLKFSNYGSAIGRDVLAFLRETTILQMAS
jgi:hypothetical protein